MIQTIKNIAIIILLIAVVILATKQCKQGDLIEVTIPEQSGVIAPAKPINTVIPKEVIGQILTSQKTTSQNQQPDVDSTLIALIIKQQKELANFKTLNDSLKNIKYEADIALREYERPFEDSLIKGKIWGYAFGEVETAGLKYTIKEQKKKVEVKSYKILLGAELGSNVKLDRFNTKVNARYQSPNGRQYSVGVDNNGIFYGGFDIPIFNYTKSRVR